MFCGNRIVIFSFYIIIIFTLLFGLWPFNLWPKNEVHWLNSQSGIEMHRSGIRGKYIPVGIIYTNDSFQIPTDTEDNTPSFSIELYLQPKSEPRYDLRSIVTIREDHHQKNLFIAQWKNNLILQTPNYKLKNQRKHTEVGISNALPRDSTRFISITSGSDGTRIYLNGELNKHFPKLFLVSEDKSVSGKLIVGNSTDGSEPWAGKIFGIGIYEDELAPERIKQHYQSWVLNDTTNLMSDRNIVALYTFDEGQGNSAKNRVGRDKKLIIPDRFANLDNRVLEPPWINFHFGKSFIFDFIINLLGFIPLGIMFSLYLRQIYGIYGKKLFIFTMVFGGMVSLSIELFQVPMPQRHSSLLDLALNIFGLCVGICIVRLVLMLKRN